ncbi:hypothetical protein IQ276_036980 [Desmonostoc muscorum LEGE 12446]|nr:hypothetical protein [Desmonostoc muscorum]MCF2151906.1 hypothetical protein [Desmonostoc muscorum LEGE 12446]
MTQQLLNKALLQIAGHLVIESDEQQRNFEQLYTSLARTKLPTDKSLLINSDFSFERSDLFFTEAIPKSRLETLDRLVENQEAQRKPTFRVFVREVPVREQLIHGSVPTWAAGAKVSQSIGPFQNQDGRQFWYDFYAISKFIALYVQGINEPVLLFRVARGRVDPGALPSRLITYNLDKGSIWINSRLLVPNAPAGTYTGLTIQGGTIALTSRPVNQGGKLTVPVNTGIALQLQLDQPDAVGVNPSTPFGIDACNLQLSLPKTVSLQFGPQTQPIQALGNASWTLYGQSLNFEWTSQAQPSYDPVLQQIVVPFTASESMLQIRQSESEFNTIRGAATITHSAWTLSVATIDLAQPTEAAGIGAILVQCGKGLVDTWQGLEGGGLGLAIPAFLVSPGQIFLADLTTGNPHAHQSLDLWKDEVNPFGTTVKLVFPAATLFFYVSNANGNELLSVFTNADFQIDRPVKVNGDPPAVRSLNSLLVIAANASNKLIYLFDDNLIQDDAQIDPGTAAVPGQFAIALTNALFKVSQPNGCLLFGALADDYRKVSAGFLFLTFGLYAYLPTLPDPYAANLGILKRQIRGQGSTVVDTFAAATFSQAAVSQAAITAWLVCRVRWQVPAEKDGNDEVAVSFHFAPLNNQFGGISFAEPADGKGTTSTGNASSTVTENPANNQLLNVESIPYLNSPVGNAIAAHNTQLSTVLETNPTPPTTLTTFAAVSVVPKPLPNYEGQWDELTGGLRQNLFALLDVSTNADLYGVSFNVFDTRGALVATYAAAANTPAASPIQVRGMEVVSPGRNVKVFTVPQISWEPLINLTPPQVLGDPPWGVNYYPNDGGPMQILNSGTDDVALAPLPLTDYLLRNFEENTKDFLVIALMTLPFGLKALAVLQNRYSFTDPNGATSDRRGSEVLRNSEEFPGGIKGSLQIQLNAGEAFISGQSDMFVGSTIQLNNVLDFAGTSKGESTLGRTVTEIFNNEFLLQPFNIIRQRGVPLTRIDLSGYGASTFSNWLNPDAATAETSQAKFEVMVGRCAHEVIQVKSIIYPWGIQVVRTITIFRTSSGYVYRFDSGWQAESSGEFDFRYTVNLSSNNKQKKDSPFAIHPGIIKGLFNVKNIIETDEIAIAEGFMTSAKIVDENGLFVDNPDPADQLLFKLQPVYFDADVEIENVVSGFQTKSIKGSDKPVVPAKKIVGYVQVAPRGIPLTPVTLRNLVLLQLGAIGGPIDCEINLANSNQKIRLNRFDFSNSFGANGTDLAFAVAGRGNVLLPKDGSWTLVKHDRDTGEVSPVPADLSVPVIRIGQLVTVGDQQALDTPIESVLLRIANPTELLRSPVDDTINYGFLQSTDTQKALFLTPAFELGKQKLLSKTPPLFVDAFRIVNSKSIFPNIGDAETNLGEAISLISKGNEFFKGGLQDVGKDVWELMDVTGAIDSAKEQGYNLLKKVPAFDLPNTEFELIDTGDGNFRIYIEYKGKADVAGNLDFNINSLLAETWKSRMANIGLVVDLAGIERLMTIRGSWDSKKGEETSYPHPEIEFSPELQPVINILEILQQLQGGDYAGALGKGLKLAMSNKAGSWEYKFEASKEIPVLRFPVPDALYNDPNTPFKLEAGMNIGAYFNAALKVTTDANELLPSAGGKLSFYGRLSIMCVSISVATVYAIGQVNLDIAADTKIGPSLRMKFGFGAQIVVGLPVAGNVSVLFVVGIEIFAASGILELSAFMLFQGHAEILGGLVAITITIEAKGTVSKKSLPGGDTRTDLACQVTFGLDISIFLVININFETSWQENRQIAGSA